MYNNWYYILQAWLAGNRNMSFAFRSKLIEVKSGYFSDSIAIGTTGASGLLRVFGGDFIHQSGLAHFDSRPLVDGVPVLLSGDSFEGSSSGYVSSGDLENVSGYFEEKIDNLTSSSGSFSNIYIDSVLSPDFNTYFQDIFYDSSGLLTGIAVWDSSLKNTKLFNKQLNYSGEYLTGVVLSDELGGNTLTKALSYDVSGNLISTTRIYN